VIKMGDCENCSLKCKKDGDKRLQEIYDAMKKRSAGSFYLEAVHLGNRIKYEHEFQRTENTS
jgi:hypothetical protein